MIIYAAQKGGEKFVIQPESIQKYLDWGYEVKRIKEDKIRNMEELKRIEESEGIIYEN